MYYNLFKAIITFFYHFFSCSLLQYFSRHRNQSTWVSHIFNRSFFFLFFRRTSVFCELFSKTPVIKYYQDQKVNEHHYLRWCKYSGSFLEFSFKKLALELCFSKMSSAHFIQSKIRKADSFIILLAKLALHLNI